MRSCICHTHDCAENIFCPQQELPKVIDGGQEPLQQEPEIVDEEFDLSDIMGEQLDSQLGSKEDRLRQLQEQVSALTSNVLTALNVTCPNATVSLKK